MTAERRGPRPAGTGPRANSSVDRHFAITTSNPVEVLLARLDRVKPTGPGKWQASCPAHDDRSPSLSIRETDDGTILIRCWAGCGAAEIVAAVGLELRDLFPPKFDAQAHRSSRTPRYSPAEVVKTVLVEATVLLLGYRALQRGDVLSLDDDARVELAIQAIGNCREVVNGYR